MNRRYFLGLLSTIGAAFVASRCGPMTGPIPGDGEEITGEEFFAVYGSYGVYGQYGQYGTHGVYGGYGSYGPYGSYGHYGGYGEYGVYGTYGSYGNYGYYGPYGGMYGLWDGIRSLFIKPSPHYNPSSKRMLAMLERLTDRPGA